MCFSAGASLAALATGASGQAILWARGDPQSRALAIGLISLTAMQLYEYIMWKYPCSENLPSKTNMNTSRIAMITNLSQPLFLAIPLLYITRKAAPAAWNAILIGSIVYSFLILFAIMKVWPEIQCSAPAGRSTRGDQCTKTSCGLEWQWTSKVPSYIWPSYLILLNAAVITLVKPKVTAFAAAAFVDISLALSIGLHNNQRSVGSHWCFYAVLLPWIFLLLPRRP